MLFDYDGQRIDSLPQSQPLDDRINRLSPQVCEAILSGIQKAIDERDSFKALWISEALTKSQQEALLQVTDGHAEQARRLFGQIVWEAVRRREDSWFFYHPDRTPLDGVYYFRCGGRREPWPQAAEVEQTPMRDQRAS